MPSSVDLGRVGFRIRFLFQLCRITHYLLSLSTNGRELSKSCLRSVLSVGVAPNSRMMMKGGDCTNFISHGVESKVAHCQSQSVDIRAPIGEAKNNLQPRDLALARSLSQKGGLTFRVAGPRICSEAIGSYTSLRYNAVDGLRQGC